MVERLDFEMFVKIVPIVFFAFVVMVILNLASLWLMMFRLAKRAPRTSGKLAWLTSGSDEISTAYLRAFPNSHLPFFIRLTFWLLIAAAAILLIAFLIRR